MTVVDEAVLQNVISRSCCFIMTESSGILILIILEGYLNQMSYDVVPKRLLNSNIK